MCTSIAVSDRLPKAAPNKARSKRMAFSAIASGLMVNLLLTPSATLVNLVGFAGTVLVVAGISSLAYLYADA